MRIEYLSTAIKILILSPILIKADTFDIRARPEITINHFNGPLDKNFMELVRGAETLEIKNSIIPRIDGNIMSIAPNLRKLAFINCTIDVDAVDLENMFNGAINLKEFYCIRVTAREIRPEALRKAPIEVFVLTDNIYKKLPGNMFNKTKLTKLELCRNHLEDIEEDAFSGLDKLEILDLTTNKLKNIPKSVLTPLKNIKTIKLRENMFESFKIDELPNLKNLEFIDLGKNPTLKELKLDQVNTIAPRLKRIDISGSQISQSEINQNKEKYPEITLIK